MMFVYEESIIKYFIHIISFR